jgi:hypothetical protein
MFIVEKERSIIAKYKPVELLRLICHKNTASSTRQHGETFHTTAVFILVAVRT